MQREKGKKQISETRKLTAVPRHYDRLQLPDFEGRGVDVNRAGSADGFCFDECAVTVRFSLFHWLRGLFGR